jgi:hypothetical protein
MRCSHCKEYFQSENEMQTTCGECSTPAPKPPAMSPEQKLLSKIKHWAQSKCPCHEETPNPCPLCGASVENLEPCKAVENTFPRDILREINVLLPR